MAKKENKNNDVNINDIDSMVADVKKLAMKKQQKTKEKKVETIVAKKEKKTTADKPIQEELIIEETDDKPIQEELIIEETADKPIQEELIIEETAANVENNTKSEEKKEENNINEVETEKNDKTNDDLSFIDKVKEEKPVKQEPQKKSIKITPYGQAYTPTWCGYGYTEK